MGSKNNVLAKLIQDSVLKLATTNLIFSKTLEIDGIICVSTGEDEPEIVVKMHRTIVKPQNVEERDQSRVNFHSQHMSKSREQFGDCTTNVQNRLQGHQPKLSQINTPPTVPPILGSSHTSQHATLHSQHALVLPAATTETPGGRVTQQDQNDIKVEPSDDTHNTDPMPDPCTSTSASILGKHKADPDTQYAQHFDNIKHIKTETTDDEPITIELDDDDEEGEDYGEDSNFGGEGEYEEGEEGATWMEGYDTDLQGIQDTGTQDNIGGEAALGEDTGAEWFPPSNASNMLRKTKHASRYQPSQCQLCKKVFYDKSTLNRHIRIHSGDKPFCCTICGKSFNQRSNFQKHLKGVHI